MSRATPIPWRALLILCASFAPPGVLRGAEPAANAILRPRALLEGQSFWDNRDWDWYEANIPFFDCPDAAINTTYYYRWELLTKHLTYGSPQTGYVFTEFIDRPFWSGRYGAISCPAGHQLYEARWLKQPRVARDYARYWFRTPGAEPRRYSCWIADAIWALHQVHPDVSFLTGLLPDLKDNFQTWERERYSPEVGLFWQTGHDDGMEININSRQTRDEVRGAPGYRPTLNSYLAADARAIARIADLAHDEATARAYRLKAENLERTMREKLWDPRRQFFFHMFKNEEEKNGHVVKAGSLTYQSGPFAGNPHGRELIGYVPWQFGLAGRGHDAAWKFLPDRDYFFADFGPTVTEGHDPQFLVARTCCVWSGQSWPYATTQTLKALANLLQEGKQDVVTRDDYFDLFSAYTRTHRKDGRPYIAEAANPDTGSWEGHDSYNHSEHYFHSGYVDLVITGLVGLQPRDDDVIDADPLAPSGWNYFALDDVAYRGRRVAVVWDRDGRRYGRGRGLRMFADGREIASSERLQRLSATLPPRTIKPQAPEAANFAVNNDGDYFPRVLASYQDPKTPALKLIDGNFWYHRAPPNRWTFEGSPNAEDWCAIDFGIERRVDTVKLYVLDDGEGVVAPSRIALESWDGARWVEIPRQVRSPESPAGHRANVIRFPALSTSKLRAIFTHAPGARTGLSEFEAWGDASQPLAPAPPPVGNLAHNPGNAPFPKASASFTSRFDRIATVNDGRMVFTPNPPNRWTSYESPNASDWLEIDFGRDFTVARVELAIYDDRGGVQAPASYDVQFWDGTAWRAAEQQIKNPETPLGGQLNEVRFQNVTTRKLRVVFTHRGPARSGVTEVFIWPD